MASTTLSVLTPTLLGATISAKASVGSTESITIQAATAASELDFATLYVRIAASGGSVTPTLTVGTGWSSIGQGSKALTVIASSASAIIGGHDFESARFLHSDGTIVISFTGTGTASIEAYQMPRATE